MKSRIHETVTGHRIEFDEPDPKLARFLARVEKLVEDDKLSEDDAIALVHSSDNPILELSPIGAALVTKDTLANPVYRVLKDLLERKRIATRGINVAKLAAGYTLTVAEVAERLDMHESAVRQAIQSGRLASWVKEGRHYLHPKWVDQFAATQADAGKRGPKAEAVPKRAIAR